jgi:serine/threonine-protein kinase RsbW
MLQSASNFPMCPIAGEDMSQSDQAPPTLLTISANLKNLATIRSFVQEQMLAMGLAEDKTSALVLATDELATNIVIHGYKSQAGSIEVGIKRDGDSLLIVLRDRAPVFDPNTAASPDTTAPLEKRPLGGMGVFLAKRAADEIRHRKRRGGGNEVTLIKKGLFVQDV